MTISEKQRGFFSLGKYMEETILMVLAGTSPSIELLSWRMEESDYSIAVDGGFLSFSMPICFQIY